MGDEGRESSSERDAGETSLSTSGSINEGWEASDMVEGSDGGYRTRSFRDIGKICDCRLSNKQQITGLFFFVEGAVFRTVSRFDGKTMIDKFSVLALTLVYS